MYSCLRFSWNAARRTGAIATCLWLSAAPQAVAQTVPVPKNLDQAALGDRPQPSPAWQLLGYPLAEPGAPLLSAYGWQMDSTSQTAVFHGGVDLAAGVGDAVVAIGEGTVAFAGEQPDYGLLVVVNHAQGLQTRYAHLGAIAVQPGQVIGKGDRLGQVGQTGTPSLAQPHLHFEVRLNSPLGWIAQDPQGYFSMPSQLPVADGSPAARAQRLVPY